MEDLEAALKRLRNTKDFQLVLDWFRDSENSVKLSICGLTEEQVPASFFKLQGRLEGLRGIIAYFEASSDEGEEDDGIES